MAARRPTIRELIRQRRRFVGRRQELAAFRENFAVPPEDAAHHFLFHVRGDAGVGKTTLLRQLENTAREHRALTASVDESLTAPLPEEGFLPSGLMGISGSGCLRELRSRWSCALGTSRVQTCPVEHHAGGVLVSGGDGSACGAGVGALGQR